jgi:hypothetical protein
MLFAIMGIAMPSKGSNYEGLEPKLAIGILGAPIIYALQG